MKSRLEQFLPNLNNLPTTKKDNQRVNQSIAMSTFGLFATRESATIAHANRDNTILAFKQRARTAWLDNHINVIKQINETREKF